MQRWEPPTEYSLSDFSVSVTRRVAREREKGRRKKKKKKREKEELEARKRVEPPSPLPEYVSLNLNAYLSRFPAFVDHRGAGVAPRALLSVFGHD